MQFVIKFGIVENIFVKGKVKKAFRHTICPTSAGSRVSQYTA